MHLRLHQLPAELTPPMTWEEFAPHLADRRNRSRQMGGFAALAAGVTALVVGLAIWSRMEPLGAPPILSRLPERESLAQTQAAEAWLRSLPAEPAVVRVSTRGAVTDLEDRIAWVDDVLSDESVDAVNPTHLVALRHERARLVNSLAQVRYAETLASGMP